MFTTLGYYKEYYIDRKYIGTLKCEKDRETIGYTGQKTEIISETITLENGKTIKQGQTVTTFLYPINGKIS